MGRLEKHRARYRQLGINIDQACSRTESRHYPFEGLTFGLLGDLRTRVRWGASNTSFVERDSATRLRGYDDRPTLVDVPNPKTGAKDASCATTCASWCRCCGIATSRTIRRYGGCLTGREIAPVDRCALQVRAGEILKEALQQAGQDKGSIVVLDPANGDVLALVSYPLPPVGRVTRARPSLPDEDGQSVPRSGALRPLPARLHFQSGDCHGGAAHQSGSWPNRLTRAYACRTAA